MNNRNELWTTGACDNDDKLNIIFIKVRIQKLVNK